MFAHLLREAMDNWTPQHALTGVTEAMQAATALGKGRPRPHQLARYTPLQRLHQDAICEAPTDAERRLARRELQAAIDTISKEKQKTQHDIILQNVAAGGWGKNDLAQKLSDTPYLDDGSNKIDKTTRIGQMATKHHRQIFGETKSTEPLQGPHAIDELALAEKLAQPQEGYEFAVTAEDVTDAFRGCPKGKTAGRDLLPADARNAAIEAEPRLAAATA